jgi:hypothetical protein
MSASLVQITDLWRGFKISPLADGVRCEIPVPDLECAAILLIK